MAFSSGTKSLLQETVSWVAAAGICAFGVLNYDTLKATTAQLLGLPSPAEIAATEAAIRPAAASDEPQQKSVGGKVELRAGGNGHFHAEIEVNGRPVQVLVDTGATMVALTYEDAERAGIYLSHSDFTHAVNTANGLARVAPVTLDRVSLGDITVRNVKAAVSERGKLTTTLLGMSFLGRLTRVDMRAGLLVLED